jgi:hypothetical protein
MLAHLATQSIPVVEVDLMDLGLLKPSVITSLNNGRGLDLMDLAEEELDLENLVKMKTTAFEFNRNGMTQFKKGEDKDHTYVKRTDMTYKELAPAFHSKTAAPVKKVFDLVSKNFKPKVGATDSKPKGGSNASKPNADSTASKPKSGSTASKPKSGSTASKPKSGSNASKPKAASNASKSKTASKPKSASSKAKLMNLVMLY